MKHEDFSERCQRLASYNLDGVILAVDFDGTCAMHEFPKIGADVPGAVDVLKALNEAGAKLILWTMRSDQAKIKNDPHSLADGTAGQDLDIKFLRHAVEWFAERGIELSGHNCNEQQAEWTTSPKCYAHAYIDDAAIGCPLVTDLAIHPRPFVDWQHICVLLLLRFFDRGPQ